MRKTKEIIIPSVEVVRCSVCPNNISHDGNGHCDDWDTCALNSSCKDLRNEAKIDGFPIWCPLEK